MKRLVYLRADTEADLKAALPWALLDADEVVDGVTIRAAGDWIGHEPNAEQAGAPGIWAIDYIRRIETAAPVYGDPMFDPETGDANIETPAVYDERFHANLILIGAFDPDIPEGVAIDAPGNPVRVRM